MEMHIPVPQSSLVKLWLIATCLGFAAGGSVGALIELLFVARPVTNAGGDETLVLGLSAGIALSGLLQGIVLRRDPRLAVGWVLASMVGLLAGPAIRYLVGSLGGGVDEVGLLFKTAVAFLAAGALVGLAQAFVLRRHVPRSQWWIGASLVAWAISLPSGLVVGVTFGQQAIMLASVVAGGFAGGIVAAAFIVMGTGPLLGLVTGRTLAWLARTPATDA